MRPLLAGLVLSTLVAAPALACGPSASGASVPKTPPLAASLDNELGNAKFPNAELKQLKALRAEINELAARDKMQQAREVEQQAMTILGYRKLFLRCGPGIFVWMKLPLKATELAPIDD